MKLGGLHGHRACCLRGYLADAASRGLLLPAACAGPDLPAAGPAPAVASGPLHRVGQDIVCKLVPGLQDNEEKWVREFCGLPCSRGLSCGSSDHWETCSLYHRSDEQRSLCPQQPSSGKEGITASCRTDMSHVP